MSLVKRSKSSVYLSPKTTAKELVDGLNVLIPEALGMAGESALSFVLMNQSEDRDSALMLNAKANLMKSLVYYLSGQNTEEGMDGNFSIDDYL